MPVVLYNSNDFRACMYVFSHFVLLDNSLLSDSIYASLFNIVLFSLLGHVVGGWRLTLLGALGLGLLWGFLRGREIVGSISHFSRSSSSPQLPFALQAMLCIALVIYLPSRLLLPP